MSVSSRNLGRSIRKQKDLREACFLIHLVHTPKGKKNNNNNNKIQWLKNCQLRQLHSRSHRRQNVEKSTFQGAEHKQKQKKLHGPLTSHFVQLLLISIGQDKSNVTCKQLIGTRNIEVHMFRMRSKQSEPFSFCCLHL